MKMLNECPRRYVHFHVVGRGGWPGGHRNGDSRAAEAWRLGARRKKSDLFFRAISSSIKNWLATQYCGEVVSPHSLKVQMTALVRNNLTEQGVNPDDENLSVGIADGVRRLVSLAKAPLLGDLSGDDVDEWFPLDRLAPHWVGNCRVYVVPDLVARIGEEWHLVRIATQIGRRVPTEQQQLELGLLLKWAISEHSLPSDPERFVVHRIGWQSTRWLDWSCRGCAVWLDASRAMLAHDLNELRFTHRSDPESVEVERLPSAVNRRLCNECGYRDTCSK